MSTIKENQSSHATATSKSGMPNHFKGPSKNETNVRWEDYKVGHNKRKQLRKKLR